MAAHFVASASRSVGVSLRRLLADAPALSPTRFTRPLGAAETIDIEHILEQIVLIGGNRRRCNGRVWRKHGDECGPCRMKRIVTLRAWRRH